MEKRRLGRTGHESTVFIFGAFCLGKATQAESDAAMDLVRSYGVNHVDVAPSYDEAELRLGPWLEKHRSEVFLGCKTFQRKKQDAREELYRSLERLRTDYFDLYQLHAVNEMEELDHRLGPGAAIEAILDARDEGLVKYIGITGHGYYSPAVHAAALERFDFDTVMTSLNYVQWKDPKFRADWERLFGLCAEKDVGLMIIKTVAKGPWGSQPQNFGTWYEPFKDAYKIEQAVRFVLSQPVTGFTNPGDLQLLELTLQAAENFRPMSAEEQEELVRSAQSQEPLFTAERPIG